MPTKTSSPKSLLTKALLLDAAARIPHPFQTFRAGDQTFMCHAVEASAAVGRDPETTRAEFRDLLDYHGVSHYGDLGFLNAEGHWSVRRDDDEVLQAHRFDFLTLLAISGVR